MDKINVESTKTITSLEISNLLRGHDQLLELVRLLLCLAQTVDHVELLARLSVHLELELEI